MYTVPEAARGLALPPFDVPPPPPHAATPSASIAVPAANFAPLVTRIVDCSSL